MKIGIKPGDYVRRKETHPWDTGRNLKKVSQVSECGRFLRMHGAGRRCLWETKDYYVPSAEEIKRDFNGDS